MSSLFPIPLSDDIIAAYIQAVPAAAIALAALLISFNQNRLEKRKAQRDLFEKFNQRFNSLNEDLNAIRAGSFAATAQKSAESVVQDYLNLCSEEYLWRKRGFVDEEVWSAWLSGIHYYLKSPAILKVFVREQKTAPYSYYGFFKEVNAQVLEPGVPQGEQAGA